MVNTCGEIDPCRGVLLCSRSVRWRHYRGGGGPLWLVREVAAIWGGPLWVVRGQIYGFTNTCVCINYNSSLTDLLRDHDVQLA